MGRQLVLLISKQTAIEQKFALRERKSSNADLTCNKVTSQNKSTEAVPKMLKKRGTCDTAARSLPLNQLKMHWRMESIIDNSGPDLPLALGMRRYIRAKASSRQTA